MRAARFRATGGPDVVVAEDVPDPGDPRGDELLVQVTASSVNGTDLGLRRGGMAVVSWGRMPFTLGFDLAGTVLRCGPEVTAFAPGDRVVALLGHGGGAQAGLVRVRQGRAASAPASVGLVEAAALPLAGLTALQALHQHAHLHRRPPGTRVLVVGAAGGIGSMAVQLAALAGAHVTGAARGAALDAVVGMGAHDVLAREDWDAGSTRAGGRWDVVLDTPGALGVDEADVLLAPGGVLVSTRPVGRDALRARVRPGLLGGGRRFASVMTSARSQDLARLGRLVDAGRLRLVVSSVHDLERAADAHRAAEAHPVGKVVVRL